MLPSLSKDLPATSRPLPSTNIIWEGGRKLQVPGGSQAGQQEGKWFLPGEGECACGCNRVYKLVRSGGGCYWVGQGVWVAAGLWTILGLGVVATWWGRLTEVTCDIPWQLPHWLGCEKLAGKVANSPRVLQPLCEPVAKASDHNHVTAGTVRQPKLCGPIVSTTCSAPLQLQTVAERVVTNQGPPLLLIYLHSSFPLGTRQHT